MKPTPSQLELIFLHDVEQRLKHLHVRLAEGYSGVPETLGLQSVVNCRIAEVQARRDNELRGENNNANEKDQ